MKKNIGYTLLIIIFGYIFYFINYHVGIAKVISSSMNPTLKKNDYVVFYKSKKLKIKKYDIVIFKHDTILNIKRCLGVPKDSIFYYKKKIYNDELSKRFKKKSVKLIIPYKGFKLTNKDLKKYRYILKTDNNNFDMLQNYIFDKNYFYLVGDNIINSIDSKDYGLIENDAIVGKYLLKF